MKKAVLLALAVPVAFILSCTGQKSLIGYADPFVGTSYTGHTTPAAAYPFGSVQPGPQTGNLDWEHCSGYVCEDERMFGFTQNKLSGTGVGDLGDILLMPFSGAPEREDYSCLFDKATERAYPGFYGVSLPGHKVKAAMTCTPHVAIYEFTFDGPEASLYVDCQNAIVATGGYERYRKRVLASEYKTVDETTFAGDMRTTGWEDKGVNYIERDVHYAIVFDHPAISEEDVKKDTAMKAPQKVFTFDLAPGEKLLVKVSLSSVSSDNALENIREELPGWDFPGVLAEAEKAWEDVMHKVEIKGSEEQRKIFYTSMYHLFTQPNNLADVNGQYRGADDKVSTAQDGAYYSTLSLWDTFRAAHPLYTVIATDMVAPLVNSMLEHCDAQGYLPIWPLWGQESFCMIGNHAVPVVVEACLKDFPGIDPERAYAAVRKSLTENHYNSYWDIYDKYGYYPFDLIRVESASRTLESSYDDYCAALLARKLGKEDDYAYFMKRSHNYRNLLDPESLLIRGKDSKGNWRTPFDKFMISHASTHGGDYTEGNAWQYTFHIQQDFDWMVQAEGGPEAFATKLDSLFFLTDSSEAEGFTGDVTGLIGQYAHGNEPSHHVIYFYTMLGKPERTAELVREVFDKFYKPVRDGLCGNDDCGQMSAWYIFSALGFYPVDTVSGEYVIGAPQIPEAVIPLPGGKKFTMKAHGLSEANQYVKAVKIDGVPVTDWRIRYDQIMAGCTLEFEMGPERD